MRPRRHLAPPLLSTMAGRRLVRQVGVVTGAFAIGYFLTVFWLFPAPLFSAGDPVPRVLYRPTTEAKERLEKLGFRVKIDAEESHPRAPRGTIIWQDPPPGVVLPKGGAVHLTISSGPAEVPVPDVVGLEADQAKRILEAAGLTTGTPDSIPASADRGVVIATRPGQGVGRDPGSAIVLVVSSGPAEISVPDVIGMTNQQARDRLEQAGLKAGAVTARMVPNRPAGLVIDQRPAPGTLSPRDGPVDLILSRKPNP